MLYTQYIKELYGRDCIETEHGFITFAVMGGNVCHIDVIYIRPEFRATGRGSALALEMMKQIPDIDLFVCEIDTRTSDPTTSLRAVLAFGFKIMDLKDPYIRLAYKREPQ